jgi:cyclohexadieny/prephenate dehydrogenase
MMAPLFSRIAILGIGLIGSSLARAVKRHGLAKEVVIYDRDEAHSKQALELGAADRAASSAGEAVSGADLVVFAAPIGANEELAAAIAPHLQKGAIVSDVGSVKMAVIRDIGPHMPEGVHLVPAHPIAGTEKSGPAAGFAELFEGRWCILTPPPGTDQAAIDK